MKKYLEFSKKVAEAIKRKKAIVALESTIISHGMPYPQNVAAAREVENIIRENGAVPATIAIINGKIKIGLSDEELEMFGKSKDVAKVSRRDIGHILATKQLGATTVAGTMICANLADIHIFVTGGIGGVHRNAETTFDISADLEELAITNVAVVCAGAKSILDLGLTLEYLETKGVPVIGYKTKVLPAFFSRESEFKLNVSTDSAEVIANSLKTKWNLNVNGGAIIVNPIPKKYDMDAKYINKIIEDAIIEADKNNIKGKDITPFLLSKISKLTDGKSLESNIALIKNNAILGAQIAVEFNKLK